MAQTIQLPIDVNFSSARRKWEVRRASLAEVQETALPKSKSPLALLSVSSLFTTGKTFALEIEPVGSRGIVSSLTPRKRYRYESLGHASALTERYAPNGELIQSVIYGAVEFDVLVSFQLEPGPEQKRDPWKMREEFLSLKQESGSLARFLTKWGDWDFSPLFEISSSNTILLGNSSVSRTLGVAVPELIWEQQTFFKAALSGDSKSWLMTHARVPQPQRQLQPPFFSMTDKLCLSAIHTTITMDKVRDVPYRLCHRHDCGNVFELTTKHDKRYCTQECAHLVSVRRGREASRNKAKEKKR